MRSYLYEMHFNSTSAKLTVIVFLQYNIPSVGVLSIHRNKILTQTKKRLKVPNLRERFVEIWLRNISDTWRFVQLLLAVVEISFHRLV